MPSQRKGSGMNENTGTKVNNSYAWLMGFPQEPRSKKDDKQK